MDYVKIVLYGLLLWVIPYVSGMGLYGVMTTDELFFKTLMVVIGGVSGLIATIGLFRDVKKDLVKTAWITAIVWIMTSWLLDFALLIPWSQQPIDRYFMEIGLRYISMVSMPLTVAYTRKK